MKRVAKLLRLFRPNAWVPENCVRLGYLDERMQLRLLEPQSASTNKQIIQSRKSSVHLFDGVGRIAGTQTVRWASS